VIGETFILKIRQAAEKRILFLPHAVAQMNHPQRMVAFKRPKKFLLL
jgi:hypothetical protein